MQFEATFYDETEGTDEEAIEKATAATIKLLNDAGMTDTQELADAFIIMSQHILMDCEWMRRIWISSFPG
jgi:hypothetical protein